MTFPPYLPPVKTEVLDRKKVLAFFQQVRPADCNIDDRHYIYGMSRVTLADLFLMEVALGHMDVEPE
jgi:hypothetical protein